MDLPVTKATPGTRHRTNINKTKTQKTENRSNTDPPKICGY